MDLVNKYREVALGFAVKQITACCSGKDTVNRGHIGAAELTLVIVTEYAGTGINPAAVGGGGADLIVALVALGGQGHIALGVGTGHSLAGCRNKVVHEVDCFGHVDCGSR